MKIIGITGGIGSGKSTVCMIFREMGYPIYDADSQAKIVMNQEGELKNQLIALFGQEAYLSDGTLNRPKIGEIIFQQPTKLQEMNQLVLPAMRDNFDAWVKEISQISPRPFCVKEAAILFESGTWKGVDKIITVYAPKSIRIARVMKRNNMTQAQVIQRMENQLPDIDKVRRADYTIYNDGIHALIPQVRTLVQKLILSFPT